MASNSQHPGSGRVKKRIRWHQRHLGLYSRVAAKMGVSGSYVSLVAKGTRRNEGITMALSRELEALVAAVPK